MVSRGPFPPLPCCDSVVQTLLNSEEVGMPLNIEARASPHCFLHPLMLPSSVPVARDSRGSAVALAAFLSLLPYHCPLSFPANNGSQCPSMAGPWEMNVLFVSQQHGYLQALVEQTGAGRSTRPRESLEPASGRVANVL